MKTVFRKHLVTVRSAPGPLPNLMEHDIAVNNTAEDAAGAKKSAAELGYFDDQFIKFVFFSSVYIVTSIGMQCHPSSSADTFMSPSHYTDRL